MKRELYLALLLAVGIADSFAQTRVDLKNQTRNSNLSASGPTSPVQTGTALPGTCTVGELYFLSSATAGQNLYGCSAANTWTPQAGSPSSALPAPTGAGQVLMTDAEQAKQWGDLVPGSGLAKTLNGTALTWSADSTVVPFLALDNAFLGNNGFAGKLYLTPGATQELLGWDTIDVSTTTLKPITSTTGVTLTTTPTIGPGDDGQQVYLLNVGSYNITLQDRSQLAGSNLCLAGSINLTLAAKGIVHLVYSAAASCWTQVGGSGSGSSGGGGSGSSVSSVYGRSGAVTAQSGDYTTALVPESSNLYFTNARAAAAAPVQSIFGRMGVVAPMSGDYTTAQVSESGNLYFTNTRAAAAAPVQSIFGRTGVIAPQSGDYTTAQVAESGNLYFTTDRARAAFTAGSGITLSNGVISATGGGGGGGDTTLVANSGAAGASVLKTGTNVTGRKLVAGANVTITENTDDITIAASGGGGGGASGLQRDFYAAACQSASASLAWNVATASAPTPDCVIGANGVIYGVAKFSNSATQAMQQSLDLPASVASITFDFGWRAMAAGGDVVWQVRYVVVNADGTASDDPDLNGAATAAATAVTAQTDRLLRSTISISPASAGGKRIYFTVFRDNAHASDTFTDGTYTPELAKVTVRVQ